MTARWDELSGNSDVLNFLRGGSEVLSVVVDIAYVEAILRSMWML